MDDLALLILIVLPFLAVIGLDAWIRVHSILKHKQCLREVASAVHLKYEKEASIISSRNFLKSIYGLFGKDQHTSSISGRFKGSLVTVDSIIMRFRQINETLTRVRISHNSPIDKMIITKKSMFNLKRIPTGYADFDRKIQVVGSDSRITQVLHNSLVRESILELKNPRIEIHKDQLIYLEPGLITDRDHLIFLLDALTAFSKNLEAVR
jgi:hypothetical protein